MARFEKGAPINGLRVMATLGAARDFGLEPWRVAEIARRCDPRIHGFDALVEALAAAVIEHARLSWRPPRA